MSIAQLISGTSSIGTNRYVIDNFSLPLLPWIQHGGERDIRRPSDYATGATNGDMEDAEEDDVDVAAGSPILLNSISMKRGPDDEQFKASIGDTGDRIVSYRLYST